MSRLSHLAPQSLTANPPLRRRHPSADSRSPAGSSSPKAQDHPNAVSRSPQGAAPLNGAAMVAAALTGGLRRAEPPAGRSRRGFQGCTPTPSFQRRPRAGPPSSTGSRSKASSTIFAGRKQGLPRLRRRRRPGAADASASSAARTPRRRRPLPLPAVSATSLASSPPTACKPGAMPMRSRA